MIPKIIKYQGQEYKLVESRNIEPDFDAMQRAIAKLALELSRARKQYSQDQPEFEEINKYYNSVVALREYIDTVLDPSV